MNICKLILLLSFLAGVAIAADDNSPTGASGSPFAVDLFGGFYYFNTPVNSYPRQGLHGWEGGVAVGANRWLGGEASAFGYYKNFLGIDKQYQGAHARPRVSAGP